jgi:hypothetical protein
MKLDGFHFLSLVVGILLGWLVLPTALAWIGMKRAG